MAPGIPFNYAFLNDNFAENSTYGDWSYRADAEVWKELPTFDYDPPELASILSNNISNLGILGIWVVMTFGLLSASIKKI